MCCRGEICIQFISLSYNSFYTLNIGWSHLWSETMTGLLASKGIKVSEVNVGKSLKTVQPGYHLARCTATAHLMNPVPYHADYFGHKLHVDQNEKLVMYGVTHIGAVDGKIVGFISMPVKNNVEIYAHLYW